MIKQDQWQPALYEQRGMCLLKRPVRALICLRDYRGKVKNSRGVDNVQGA